jgi:hypothetical protein
LASSIWRFKVAAIIFTKADMLRQQIKQFDNEYHTVTMTTVATSSQTSLQQQQQQHGAIIMMKKIWAEYSGGSTYDDIVHWILSQYNDIWRLLIRL